MTDPLCNQGTGVWPPLAAVINEAQTASNLEDGPESFKVSGAPCEEEGIMTWKYAIGKRVDRGSTYFSVVEVYMDDGEPWGYTEASVKHFENAKEARQVLKMMREDCKGPAIDLDELSKRKCPYL
jgi:hypothetical protein